MRRSVFFLAISLLMSLFMCSCLDGAKSDFTPQIMTSIFLRNGQDTLRLKSDSTGIYTLDTLAVGDSVRYAIRCETYSNDLLSVSLKQEGTSVKNEVVADNVLASVILPSSNVESCKLDFINGLNGIQFPMLMTAQAEGSAVMTFTVESDSKFSPANIQFRVAVK